MFWTPLLIGAGVGALGGLLTGNDPLKTAALGAAVGGTGGAAGAWGGGQAAAAGTTAGAAVPNLAASATPVTLGSASTVPTASELGIGFGYGSATPAASYLPTEMAANYAASASAVPTVAQSFNPYTGLYDDALNASESYIDKGLIGSTNFNPVANIGATSQQTPFFAGNEVIKDVGIPEESLFEQLKPYANVQNLAGASSIMNQYSQRKPLPTAPSGGVSRGQAPQGTDVMALLASIKPREQRRISLL
jgi:hypothetical protein